MPSAFSSAADTLSACHRLVVRTSMPLTADPSPANSWADGERHVNVRIVVLVHPRLENPCYFEDEVPRHERTDTVMSFPPIGGASM